MSFTVRRSILSNLRVHLNRCEFNNAQSLSVSILNKVPICQRHNITMNMQKNSLHCASWTVEPQKRFYSLFGDVEKEDESLAAEEDLLIPNSDEHMRSVKLPGTNVQLDILKGNLLKEDVDAIVNVTNTHLKMDGGLSTTILQYGGNVIQRECEKIYKQREVLNAADVVVTGSGNGRLKCKIILHAVKPSYHHEDIHDWMVKTFVNILDKAEEYKCTSLSTTALKESHSTHGFPSLVCANAFYDALLNHYVKNGKNKNLKLIRLVESNEDVADIFKNRFDEVFEQTKQ